MPLIKMIASSKALSLSWLLLALLLGACQPNAQKQTEATARGADTTQAVPHLVHAHIEAGIREHIRQTAAAHAGLFPLQTDSHELQLELVRVHTEYLAQLGPERAFACVDLAARNGDVYDVDFFMEGRAGDFRISQTTVHKHNGQPYYLWEQRPGDGTWQRVPVAEANDTLLGVIHGTDRFVFRYQVGLPELRDSARLWLPIPQSGRFQTVKLLEKQLPGKVRRLSDESGQNEAFFLSLGPAQSEQLLDLRYQVQRKEKKPYAAPRPASDLLQPTPLLPASEELQQQVDSALQGLAMAAPLQQARALYDYVIDHMSYIKNQNYGTGDAQHACTAGVGNCSEFHSYFIALARNAGIPARFAIGAGIPANRDEGAINGYHCWAEFYAEGKWWPIDISEADKFSALSTYYFGRHPANRITLSKGRQLRFDPAPLEEAIPFFAYPVLVEEGQKKPVRYTRFSFQRLPETAPQA